MTTAVRPRTALAVFFYGTLVALIAMIMFEVLPRVVPGLIAGRISRNSEGIVLVLVLALWIQFVRPRLQGSSREWPVTAVVAVACLGVGLLLFFAEPINRVKTLNETFLATALLIPYIQLRRPFARWIPLACSGALLALVLLWNENATVTLMAEALGALIMTTIALDIVDRGILDDTAGTVLRVRLAWYGFLVLGPALFWRTDNGASIEGGLGALVTYAGRTTEVFLCLLALELYFAVGHGRIGSRYGPPAPTPSPVSESVAAG